MAISKIKTGSLTDSAVTTAKISDGTIVNADISPSAAIVASKTVICTAVTDTNAFNISLLGFKMAVNEGLTVFNLVDGVVDEFHDESGTDEGEGSNDLYNCGSDFYINSTSPTGGEIPGKSAGFGMTSITEPDTSTVGTNPASGAGTFAQFIATGTTVDAKVWGASGAGGGHSAVTPTSGGGGGYVEGTIAVTPGQTLYISAGEGGQMTCSSERVGGFFGGGNAGVDSAPNPKSGTDSDSSDSSGGGIAGVFKVDYPSISPVIGCSSAPGPVTGNIYLIAGAGGGGGGHDSAQSNTPHSGPLYVGGGGGGSIGNAGGTQTEQVNATPDGGGGGGDQEQGGQGSPSPQGGKTDGKFLKGGDANGPDVNIGAGGGGFFGGGAGNFNPGGADDRSGGGGSSYYGHPQVTSGATTGGANTESGGSPDPYYPSIPYAAGEGTGPGENGESSPAGTGKDGYVLLTSPSVSASATSTVITSNAFAAGSVPTTSRIVVFEENVATPTLNTDIIASISRDGGSNFTTATLSDSGYVTGSSGQSMRWKLALANNSVKIHGVSLQWA